MGQTRPRRSPPRFGYARPVLPGKRTHAGRPDRGSLGPLPDIPSVTSLDVLYCRHGPAIDDICRAVDRRGAVGQQEGRELGDLVGQARSSDRDPAERSHEPVARGVLVHIMLLAQPANERGRGRRFDNPGAIVFTCPRTPKDRPRTEARWASRDLQSRDLRAR